MSNLKIFGGLALPSEAHAPKSFYNKQAEENSRNMFTNKHRPIMNFEKKWITKLSKFY